MNVHHDRRAICVWVFFLKGRARDGSLHVAFWIWIGVWIIRFGFRFMLGKQGKTVMKNVRNLFSIRRS